MWLSRRKIETVCIAASLLYALVFIALPYLIIATFSFWEKHLYTIQPALSLENYSRALADPAYLTIILNSAQIAVFVTAISAILGYILAYYLAAYARHRNLLFFLLIVPLWTSFLLRAYIWTIILGRHGILNSALMRSGLVSEPVSFLLYNQFSISLALIYIFIPFIALPVYAALEKIPPNFIEASRDLGAHPTATFRYVVFPLTIPALAAGSTVVFCLSFGDFITPTLLGGSSDIMIANVILAQFGAAFNWPFGSALAIIVLVVVLALVTLSSLLGRSLRSPA